MKKKVTTASLILGIIAGLFLVLIGSFQYVTKYKYTDIDMQISPDERCRLILQMKGEPEWPFGSTHGRIIAEYDDKILKKLEFAIADDGAMLGKENWSVVWGVAGVQVTLKGSEQEDRVLQILYDGTEEFSGYRNEKWHFTLDIPESWEGKYQVCEEEDTIRFLQTATYEKYGTGTGCLFYITCIEGTKTQEEVDAMVDGAFSRPIIMQSDKVTYVYGMPTDVQYPIWTDADAEDAEIAGEYEKMATDITYIIESIRPLAE